MQDIPDGGQDKWLFYIKELFLFKFFIAKNFITDFNGIQTKTHLGAERKVYQTKPT